MDCSPQGSSVHGIFQARIQDQVAIFSSRGSSWPRDRIRVSYVSWIGRRILYHYHHPGSPYLWFVCPDFPIASCCLCIANSSPLPRVTFLTPCFSIRPHQHWQLLLSCWGAQGRFWRRLWHGRATWASSVVKGLWWWQCSGSWNLQEWAEEALAWAADEPAQLGRNIFIYSHPSWHKVHIRCLI